MFYRNCTTSSFAYELPIPDCQDVSEPPSDQDSPFRPGCNINTLRTIKGHLLSGDWQKRCKSSTSVCQECKKFKDSGSNYSENETDEPDSWIWWRSLF